MTRAVNDDIGHISRAKLAALLPENVPMRRGKNGKLYLSTWAGSWFLNTPDGQDALLTHGVVYGPDGPIPAAVVDVPEAVLIDPEQTPANDAEPPVAANDDNNDKPKKRRGGLFEFD